MSNEQSSRSESISKLVQRLLCKIGLHSFGYGWIEDGKGNSGDYCECKHCRYVLDPYDL